MLKNLFLTCLGCLFFGNQLFAQVYTTYPPNIYADSAKAPFMHGVASGDPTNDALVIWTRITVDSVTTPSITVNWELAADTTFSSILQSGSFLTDTARDYTVKVDVTGLSAGSTYYYRFNDGSGNYSATGRGKTVPTGTVDIAKFAVASCSNIYGGYFNAYDRIADREDLDAVIHLGDFIYNYASAGQNDLRVPDPWPDNIGSSGTVHQWRDRQAYYRLDPDLRRAMQNHAWFILWDNHDRHYSNTATGMQACMEWWPVREDPTDARKMYRNVKYGDLVDLYILDMTTYRFEDTLTGGIPSTLGETQHNWWIDGLTNSTPKWRITGNQKNFATWSAVGIPSSITGITGDYFTTTGWDGAVDERTLVTEYLRDNSIDNFMILTGDLHISMGMEIAVDPFDTTAYNHETGVGAVGVEFLPTGVSSANFDENGYDELLVDLAVWASMNVNPHHQYFEVVEHGYGYVEVNPDSIIAEFRFVNKDTIDSGDSLGMQMVMLDGDNHWKRNPETSVQEAEDLLEGLAITNIFPNPADDILNFKINSPKAVDVDVYVLDVKGKYSPISNHYSLQVGEQQFSIPTSELGSGTYMLVMYYKGQRTARKFVIAR